MRLWNPGKFRPCRAVYRCHNDWVTSVCILGTNVGFAKLLAHAQTYAESALWNRAGIGITRTFSSTSGFSDNSNSVFVRLKDRFGAREEFQGEDDVYFLTGSKDGSIKLWHLGGKKTLRTYKLDKGDIKQEDYIKTCTTKPFDTEDRGTAVTCLVSLHQSTGSHFLSGHRNCSACLWDAATGDCLRVYKGHTGWITSLCTIGSLSTKFFATASDDGTTKLWDVACSDDASFSRDNEISNSEKWKGRQSAQQEGSIVPNSIWMQSRNSPIAKQDSGARLGKPNTGLATWYESENDMSRSFHEAPQDYNCVHTLIGHRGAVFSVASVNPGKTCVTGSADRTARLWSVESGQCLQIFAGHLNVVSAVTFFDENAILTGSSDQTIKLWDTNTGMCLRTYIDHKQYITDISGCGNGKTFITSSFDCTARLWAVTTATTAPSLQTLIDEAEEEYFSGQSGISSMRW